MAFDEPQNEQEPLAIQSGEQAKIAAQCVLDWADWNLSKFEGADIKPDKAAQIYEAAKSLVASFD